MTYVLIPLGVRMDRNCDGCDEYHALSLAYIRRDFC